MLPFIFSQILGGIALILVCVSYFFDKKVFLFFQIIANIFYGLGFLASSFFVAGLNTFVSTIRCLIFYVYEKRNARLPIFYLFIFSALYVSIGVIFFKTYWDIITIICPVIFTIAMMMKNMIMVKWTMLLPNFALVIFNLFNNFFTSAMLEIIEFSVIVVAIVVFYSRKKKVNESYETIKKVAFSKDLDQNKL